MNKDVYETVFAFLNRIGGLIILGVKDNGDTVGIDANHLEYIKKDLITTLNNFQKINPPCYIVPEEIDCDDKKLLAINIPMRSQVHRCNGRIFDSNGDSDIDITLQNQKVAELYIRKQSTYTENEIIPYVKLEDLRPDLIRKTRQLAVNFRPNHPWETLNDFDLLKSTQLYQENYRTGKSGFTMAAVLLFGKDDVISSVLPHYKTDAILRKENIDRYDDRDDIRTNLIESYERLMAFIAKHLPDKFYLEKDQRISLRDKIFREVISNILIHREFSSAFPAKLIIEEGRVYTENNNKPHGHGLIDPTNFTPYPKNPIIARFFKEIGRADELGSGVRNLYKFCKAYNGTDPELIEEDIFKIVISLSQATQQADQQDKKIDKILEYCKEPRTRAEIQEYVNISDREYFRNRYLKPLIGKELLKLTHPENLNNPKQKYYTVKTRRTQDDNSNINGRMEGNAEGR